MIAEVTLIRGLKWRLKQEWWNLGTSIWVNEVDMVWKQQTDWLKAKRKAIQVERTGQKSFKKLCYDSKYIVTFCLSSPSLAGFPYKMHTQDCVGFHKIIILHF